MDSAKYPRSLHWPSSPGTTSDDRFITQAQALAFLNVETVLTEKLDGGNTTITRDAFFARSHGGEPAHPSFNLLRTLHKNYLCRAIDKNISVFAEWCFAVHSIRYSMLQDYLNVIAVRNDETGEWWDWDEVCLMADHLGFPTVPVLLRGTFTDIGALEKTMTTFSGLSSLYGPTREGVVLRKVKGVAEIKDERGLCLDGLAKWVREDHVQTDEHWSKKKVEIQPTISALSFM